MRIVLEGFVLLWDTIYYVLILIYYNYYGFVYVMDDFVLIGVYLSS